MKTYLHDSKVENASLEFDIVAKLTCDKASAWPIKFLDLMNASFKTDNKLKSWSEEI